MIDVTETPVQKTTYSLISSLEYVEKVETVQYGMEQLYIDENGKLIKTTIANISDEKETVLKLIEAIKEEDVQPSILMDIVENYINQVYALQVEKRMIA